MAVDLLINEKQLAAFESFEAGKKEMPDSLFTILLPNNTLYPHPGKISVIDRAVNAQTGSIRVRLVFPNPDNALKVGMSCVVKVHNQEAAPQMMVPSKAVVEQMGEYFVFVAKDTIYNNPADSAKKKEPGEVQKPKLLAFQKKVMTGQTIGPDVIIKSGISEGDKIVIDGVQSLHDASAITTANKLPPAAPGKAR